MHDLEEITAKWQLANTVCHTRGKYASSLPYLLRFLKLLTPALFLEKNRTNDCGHEK